MQNPRFLLLESRHIYIRDMKVYTIISSSDLVRRIPSGTVLKELDKLIANGNVRPNNFGHSTYFTPEDAMLRAHKGYPIINHGYFRTLKELKSYVEMIQLLDI